MENFPQCAGLWLPPTDFREGFVLWRGIGVDYEGGVLDGSARIAIQMAHRLGAVASTAVLLWAALRMLRTPGLLGPDAGRIRRDHRAHACVAFERKALPSPGSP